MQRFMGMMPSSKIKIEERFRDAIGLKITIQAGETGWSILYADGSSEYKDVDDTVDNNFNNALNYLKSVLGDVEKIENIRVKGEC